MMGKDWWKKVLYIKFILKVLWTAMAMGLGT